MGKSMRTTKSRLLYSCILSLTFVLIGYGTSFSVHIPAALETITAEDSSTWERVTVPGLGSSNNKCIVSLCSYQGRLYAATRNDTTGFEVWRTNGTSWEQVTGPFADDPLHDFMNNIWGHMIEFNGKLYLAVSSGYQGAFLFRSVGFQIWRFDGTTWEPVIGNSVDEDESGSINGISSCADADGSYTADFSDSTKAWVVNQWQGGILRITSGSGRGRVFNIVSNTETTLVIQEAEIAGSAQYTICAEHASDPVNRPTITVGTIAVGDSYEIGMGTDENGFGEIWNKSIIDLIIFNNQLYASIGLNYQSGARILKTSDGTTWVPDCDYSFGLLHGYYPGGYPTNPTGFCLISGYESKNGQPVSSSITHFAKSSVTGTETLFVGGTGSSGCNGRAARVYRLDGSSWNAIVDYFVDDNTTGTNENGFGDDGGTGILAFLKCNFQAWSWAEYDNLLFCGIVRIKGGRMMYTSNGSSADGAWTYAVGGTSSVPNGFDGVGSIVGYAANIGSELYVYNSKLFAGTMVSNSSPGEGDPVINGADIWKGTGPGASLTWNRVTGTAFGDASILQIGDFTTFENGMYVAASNLSPSNFPGEEMPGYSGAKIYRLQEIPPPSTTTTTAQVSTTTTTTPPTVIELESFAAIAGKGKVVLQWITASEQDNAGFNIYRAESAGGQFAKINDSLIPAQGSPTKGAAYKFIDTDVRNGKTYYYKLEDVDLAGKSTLHGPERATPRLLVGIGKK